jgi:hypothetical protein
MSNVIPRSTARHRAARASVVSQLVPPVKDGECTLLINYRIGRRRVIRAGTILWSREDRFLPELRKVRPGLTDRTVIEWCTNGCIHLNRRKLTNLLLKITPGFGGPNSWHPKNECLAIKKSLQEEATGLYEVNGVSTLSQREIARNGKATRPTIVKWEEQGLIKPQPVFNRHGGLAGREKKTYAPADVDAARRKRRCHGMFDEDPEHLERGRPISLREVLKIVIRYIGRCCSVRKLRREAEKGNLKAKRRKPMGRGKKQWSAFKDDAEEYAKNLQEKLAEERPAGWETFREFFQDYNLRHSEVRQLYGLLNHLHHKKLIGRADYYWLVPAKGHPKRDGTPAVKADRLERAWIYDGDQLARIFSIDTFREVLRKFATARRKSQYDQFDQLIRDLLPTPISAPNGTVKNGEQHTPLPALIKGKPVCSVLLRKENEPCYVFGKQKDPLPQTTFRVIKALVDAWPKGLLLGRLVGAALYSTPSLALEKLRFSDPDWRKAILMPGRGSRDGYKLAALE